MLQRKNSKYLLIVDDSEDDRFFLRRVLQKYPSLSLCGEAKDGQEAIDYLLAKEPFSDRLKYPLPHGIVLDLQMPRKSGYDVLTWLKDSPFNQIPVFILSGSTLEKDQKRCFELGVQAYCSKAMRLTESGYILKVVEKWFAS